MKQAYTKILFSLLPLLLACTLGSGCGDSSSPRKPVTRLRDLDSPRFTIGCMTGIVATREAQTQLPHAKYLEYPMPIDAFTALCARKVDAVVLDRPTLEFMALAHPELTVLPENLAVGRISVATSKQNVTLMREINRFIRQYREDGTYEKMFRRWFHTLNSEMPDIPLPEKSPRVLRIGITANNEPMCFIKDRKLAGFDSEFALRLASGLDCRVEFKDMPYDALTAGLAGGRIDVAVACMDALPEREESVLFSENYVDSPITIALHRSDCAAEVAGTGPVPDAPGFAARCRRFAQEMRASFARTFLREGRWLMILYGLGVTIVITVCAVLLGTLLALPVCLLCRSGNRVKSWIATRCVSLIVGTPTLVILMILYYVVFAKIDVSGVVVAILAFGLDFAASTSITLRAGIDGVPRGQTEAALALGHKPMAAFMRFVLPQAVRTVLPVYRKEVVNTLKATSIVGYVAIMDLTKTGDIIRSRTYEAFFPLIAIAVIYFLAAKSLSALLESLELRMTPVRRRESLQQRGIR